MELNNLNDMTAFVAKRKKAARFTAAAKQLGLTCPPSANALPA